MSTIILIIIIIVAVLSPVFRCAILHPIKVVKNGIVDMCKYFKYRQWRECKTGKLIAVTGMFGKGKTLTAVHVICSIYSKYNGKRVWCSHRKKWVTQVINVVSNVNLNIPFERLVSMEQIISVSEKVHEIDEKNDTLTCTLVLGDEFSVQMNSRNFKSNVDANLLNAILTCRHYHLSFYYTTQRFQLVDKLLRDVTMYVLSASKLWRFQRMTYYDGWELENATNVMLLKPIKRACWFVQNKDYDAYDTLAVVDNLKRDYQNGNMMTEQEILALRCAGTDLNAVSPDSLSKKYKRSLKKLKK